MIYKFVDWEIKPLEAFSESSEFCIHQKFEKKENLTREEKNYVFKRLQTNSYSKQGIPLGGWMFLFHDFLKGFLVKLKFYGWQEVYAFDKTSIRAFYGHNVLKIMEMA